MTWGGVAWGGYSCGTGWVGAGEARGGGRCDTGGGAGVVWGECRCGSHMGAKRDPIRALNHCTKAGAEVLISTTKSRANCPAKTTRQ